MKHLSTLLFIFSSTLVAGWPDTTSTELITPGVIHTQYTLPGPFTLDVLEVDITNPQLTFESYRPNNLTKTTMQSAANDQPGHRVIGAINGGFFSFETGWPIHNQLVNGKPVLGIPTLKSSFAFTEEKKVFIDRFNFAGKIFSKTGTNLTINESNTNRASGKTVLYTSYKGASTGTDASGSEAALTIIAQPLATNDTLLAVVTQKGAGNISIPANGFVVSGASGTPATFITNDLTINDTVKLYLAYNSASTPTAKRIVQLISGNGHLIKNGVAYPALGDYDQSGSGFNDVRHPRTFLGINEDTTKVYLCTVDGRQATSLGMTFTEMANFLVALGLKDAFNLDGGGSTTMVVRGKVVNAPSDPGGERSVANTLQVISTAPVGSLNHLNILEDRADVFQGNTFQFHAEGKDEYLNPLPLPAGTVWSADTVIGTIDSTGLFKAKVTNDTGWVRLTFNNVSDSVKVFVRVIKQLRVVPSVLTMVPGERLTLIVRGIDSGDKTATLQNEQVQYIVNATNLNVDAQGVVTSTGFGGGTLTVTLDTVTQVIKYSSTGADTTILADTFEDLHFRTWDVTGTDPDDIFFELSNDAVVLNPPAFRIRFNAPASSNAIVNTNLPVPSRPDTIRIRVYGDGGRHLAKLFFRDKDDQQFSIASTDTIKWNNTWNDVVFRLVNATPVSGGTVDFPIAIEKIQFTVGNANLVGGRSVDTIYIDDIRVHYSNRTVAAQVLVDFNAGITGWLTPQQSNAAQLVGINIASSKLEASTEHPYEGTGSGKWTFVDDAASTADWNVRIPRGTTSEVGSMLRGSYIGAWIWADGRMDITLRTVIRDGNGQICSGPAFPVNHVGWKLIGTRLDENLFTPYLTSGKITDANNRFNGFRVQGLHADVNGKTKVFFVDKMVTSALTVPSGYIDFGATFDSSGNQVKVSWGVNSEISINRYEVERSPDGVLFEKVGTVGAVGNADTTQRYAYFDNIGSLQSAKYRIRQITNDGAQETTPIINFSLTGIGDDHFSPWTFELKQNYPNPFNPVTTIQFQIPYTSQTALKVYDILGREIATIINQELNAGTHRIEWDSSLVSSGVYFYRLTAGNYVSTKKMVVAK
ncbi:MAG: phosphodiester glycosidase family protein [Ignavibacteriales bacterium]|nr:phosphodiester glycosidase family protein [Ignavibacteriales bacterium]